MNHYEFDGEKYKKASKHQREWGNSLMEELSFNGDEMILDLGCGDGGLTEQLARMVPKGKVLGIDASMGMINAAKKRETDNLIFKQMDINDMDFENEFDLIFSNAALHWIKDHERLLKKVLLALKKNGMILWDFAGDGNCSNFFSVVKELMQSPKYRDYFSSFEWPWYMPGKMEYKQKMADIGFSRYSVTEINKDRFFADADEMIKWIDQPSIVPFMRAIPSDKQAEFRNGVIEAMLEKTLQPDGTCFETFRRIHVSAVK